MGVRDLIVAIVNDLFTDYSRTQRPIYRPPPPKTRAMLEDAIALAHTVGVPEEKVREAYATAPNAAWFRSWVAYLRLFKQVPEWRG